MWSAGDPGPRGGFTLVELMVVLAVLGVVAVTAVPTVWNRPWRLGVAEREAVAVLRAARVTAIHSGRPVEVGLDPATRRFGFTGRVMVPAPDVGLALGTGPVRFHPDGSASSASIELSRGADRRTLQVDWLTGAVRRER